MSRRQSIRLLQKVSLSFAEAPSVGSYEEMFVTFGLQSIVTSNCLLLILLMCRICLSCNCFRNQQSSSSLRSVTVLYRKFYASVFTALVSSFVLHLYSWMATTSKLSALHPDVSCRSRPGLNNVRTLQVESFMN